MKSLKKALLTLAATALVAGNAGAWDKDRPQSNFGRLDHVFLIMMENQTNTDILNNPNAPFINQYAAQVNQATQYFAVGHPSAPNYLEIVGGSNFGLSNDYWPVWINGFGCQDNAPSSGCGHAFTPISVEGLDNPVVATATASTDCNGQISLGGNPPAANNCALRNYPAAPFTPQSIADQLVAKGKSWKTYQESLPTIVPGAFGVNYSDGEFSNLSPASVFYVNGGPPTPATNIQKLYAVKHNPFAYFENIESGDDANLSLDQVVDFDGPNGLWADMTSEDRTPNFSFIVPNQCHDMHGFVSGGTTICATGGTAATNLTIQQGDAEVAKVVNGIKASKSWRHGRNAIVLVWDENDYSNAANRVVFLVETNYAANGAVSSVPYDHFSLLRTLEAGFGLSCLNHACDATSLVMNDVFGGKAH
jgi:phosphatidylinositol-3-phosphatase